MEEKRRSGQRDLYWRSILPTLKFSLAMGHLWQWWCRRQRFWFKADSCWDFNRFLILIGLVSETVLRIAAHVCRSHVFLSASRTAHEDRRLPSTQPPIPLSPCQAVKQISSSWWRLLTVFIGIPPLTLTTVPWSRLLSPILTDPLRLSGRG